MREKLKKFDPAVDKRFLIVLSGIIWSVVGIILCNVSFKWLSGITYQKATLPALAGIILSLLIHHFGFLKIVDRNIERILPMKDKVCIFAFQPWKSYLIISVMIGLGMFLRHSALPKHYLSVIYTGFGGAMILSSIRYFRVFLKLITKT